MIRELTSFTEPEQRTVAEFVLALERHMAKLGQHDANYRWEGGESLLMQNADELGAKVPYMVLAASQVGSALLTTIMLNTLVLANNDEITQNFKKHAIRSGGSPKES